MGMSWDRPLAFTRDFIDGLQPLLAGEQADVDGNEVTTHGQLNITASDTPILLAALGPKMLELAGSRVQGTTVGQCGPRTIASYIAPTLRAASDAAGRPEPRIMALIRICVTDDHAGAYALARQTAALYRAVPSYAAVQDREGLDEPADLHLIGTWERVLEGLNAYAKAGVTDFRLEIAAHSRAARDATRAALARHLNPSN
jgi:alkanesulfonate monooxygenase SsuD/methylene tetrahydromethanopterin reductase-like flavin-dependent oxidoreductase (luciferase family)